MKILFIDSASCVYDTTTYLSHPLGGTQSAVSCLSRELARAGHQVAVINGIQGSVETEGVRFLALPCPAIVLNEYDVVIPVSAAIAQTLRSIGCTQPLVLWCHHAADQPSIQGLANPAEQALFAAYAFVSQWQADRYAESFGVDRAKSQVMRNAAAPAFMTSEASFEWLRRGKPPVLGYTSTPYRGLDILLLSFAAIRKQIEGATLHIFSSMGIYSPDMADEYSSFYELARVLPGVTYVGPLPQPRLAEALSGVDVWAYPSTFAETSCISAMEAMASGNLLVTTDLGALRETTAGFAQMAVFNPTHTTGMRATQFAGHVADVCARAAADSQATLEGLAKQVAFARSHYNWKKRAAEWVEWLARVI